MQALVFGTFWNFLKNIFDSWLVEPTNAEPVIVEFVLR